MKPTAPLQFIVDPFVRRFGGELISEIVGNNAPPSSADYLFRRYNVIAELKSLQDDTFGESLSKKLGDRMAEWLQASRVVAFGTNRIESNSLTPKCQDEMFDLIGGPLQNNVVKAANGQIESTKQSLKMPNAKGLLWVASDGNASLQPNHVWYLLIRILQKKREDGSPQYSNIHALAYFSPRMLVQLPESKQPAQVWLSGVRNNGDQQLSECLTELCEGWGKYVAWAQGIEVNRVGGNARTPEDLHFLGVSPRLPRIQINDSGRANQSDDNSQVLTKKENRSKGAKGS
jgi:hypothetical protein